MADNQQGTNWAAISIRELQSIIICISVLHTLSLCAWKYVRLLIFQRRVNRLVFLQTDGTLFPHFLYCDRVRVTLFVEEVWWKSQDQARQTSPRPEINF